MNGAEIFLVGLMIGLVLGALYARWVVDPLAHYLSITRRGR